MNAPRNGYSLEDVCRLAHDYAVYIHIGVADQHVGQTPPTITIQVTSKLAPEPKVFAMELERGNARLNQAMSMHLHEYVRRVSPRKLQIITGR